MMRDGVRVGGRWVSGGSGVGSTKSVPNLTTESSVHCKRTPDNLQKG